eukprot:gene11029-biopygen7670
MWAALSADQEPHSFFHSGPLVSFLGTTALAQEAQSSFHPVTGFEPPVPVPESVPSAERPVALRNPTLVSVGGLCTKLCKQAQAGAPVVDGRAVQPALVADVQ